MRHMLASGSNVLCRNAYLWLLAGDPPPQHHQLMRHAGKQGVWATWAGGRWVGLTASRGLTALPFCATLAPVVRHSLPSCRPSAPRYLTSSDFVLRSAFCFLLSFCVAALRMLPVCSESTLLLLLLSFCD